MIGENIRKYRKEKNMSQDELAEKLNVTRQSISLWENDQTQPSLDSIVAMAQIFQVSTDDLLAAAPAEEAAAVLPAAESSGKKKGWLIIVIAIAAVLVLAAVIFFAVRHFGSTPKPAVATPTAVSSQAVSSVVEPTSSVSEVSSAATSVVASQAKQPAQRAKTTSKTVTKPAASKPTTSSRTSSTTKPTKSTNFHDVFKNFVLKNGKAAGGYICYANPASVYGGDSSSSFQLYYWPDRDEVYFSLYFPMEDGRAADFYLYMPKKKTGEYEYTADIATNGKLEYWGAGTVNAATFTTNYPLKCTSYEGDSSGELAFEEVNRSECCLLLMCLENFLSTEKTGYTLKDLGFTKF